MQSSRNLAVMIPSASRTRFRLAFPLCRMSRLPSDKRASQSHHRDVALAITYLSIPVNHNAACKINISTLLSIAGHGNIFSTWNRPERRSGCPHAPTSLSHPGYIRYSFLGMEPVMPFFPVQVLRTSTPSSRNRGHGETHHPFWTLCIRFMLLNQCRHCLKHTLTNFPGNNSLIRPSSPLIAGIRLQ